MNETFKYQAVADQRELARYLTVLAEGVESGALAVAEGNLNFTIQPRGLIDLVVKVRRKQGRTKVNLEMAWLENPLAAAPGAPGAPGAVGRP
ncbi:hypothetical protein FACS189460_3470 [Deltaproteobacteria bacterium]|nr:hypothetical protein FACS189460_3470 [Deltaproteobacteria bacterium]